MLEEKLRGKRTGDFALELHPSANILFQTDGKLQQAVFFPTKTLDDYVEQRTPSDNVWKERSLIASQLVLRYGTYALHLGLETASRVSESLVRGAYRGLKSLATKIYDQFDQQEESSFKKFCKNLAERSRTVKERVSQFINQRDSTRTLKDVATVALSLYLTTSVAGTLLSDSKPEQLPHKSTISKPYQPTTHEPTWPTTKKPTHPFQPSQPAQFQLDADRLRENYGNDAVEYALQVVDNGKKLRQYTDGSCNHMNKDTQKCGVERELRARFPAIHIPHLFGFFDDDKEVENIAMLYKARERVLNRAKKDKIDLPLSFIVAALANEGRSLDVDHYGYNDLSGFRNYGLDTFGTEFGIIVERGYLPASFSSQFSTEKRTNELGQTVTSARFDDKMSAYEAFVSVLANRQRIFDLKLKKHGINSGHITEDERLFFTYKFYNGGPQSSNWLFRKRSAPQIHQYFKGVKQVGSKGNSYVVLAGHLWLDKTGAFDTSPKNYDWQVASSD